jgi:hypothetical protein
VRLPDRLLRRPACEGPRCATSTSATQEGNRRPAPIYTAPNADAALEELERFDETGHSVPDDHRRLAGQLGAHHPFLSLPEALRRVVYITDENVKRAVGRSTSVSGDGSVAAGARRA